MTLEECYISLGGDYEDVLSRLRSEQMAVKYVIKFLDDGNFNILLRAMEEGTQEEAFRAAHTIKGMCQNLSFTRLANSSSLITEALRSGDMDSAKVMLGSVREDYERTAQAIRTFKNGLSE